MEDIEEVVTHHEVACLFLLRPRNIPHCCLQNVINTCHLHWWCCFQYFTLIQILLQNRVIDIGVDSVIDVNADIGRDVGINYEIDVDVYLCFCQ